MSWYCVRAIFAFADGLEQERTATYEERLTLWHADDVAAATALAEADAAAYARCLDDCEFTGLLQAYLLPDAPGHGAEVFSLMRHSAMPAAEYLAAFYDTGREWPDLSDGR